MNDLKVKMLQSLASVTFSYAIGEEVELSKTRANEFIKAGVAVEVKDTSTGKGRNKNADDS